MIILYLVRGAFSSSSRGWISIALWRKKKKKKNGGGGSGSKELDECSSFNRFLCFAGAELELT